MEFGALVATPGVNWADLNKKILADSFLRKIMADMHSKTNEHVGFELAGDKLLYKGRVVIPSHSRFKLVVLSEYHRSSVGGHAGEVKTYLRLASDWY